MQAIQKFRTLMQRPGKCTSTAEDYGDNNSSYDIDTSDKEGRNPYKTGGFTYQNAVTSRRPLSGYTNTTFGGDVRRYSSHVTSSPGYTPPPGYSPPPHHHHSTSSPGYSCPQSQQPRPGGYVPGPPTGTAKHNVTASRTGTTYRHQKHHTPPSRQNTARFDSLRQVDANGVPYVIENEEQLRQMSWYQPGIPREISLEILSKQEIGSFVIRDSSSHQGCYALSVKVPKYDNPNGISNYLIVPTESGGVRLKGLDKEWPNMAALVTHHTVMKEMLPCTLTLPRNAANLAFNETEQNEREEDDDYQKLADCRTMMNDLRL